MTIKRLHVAGAESNPLPPMTTPLSEWDFIVGEIMGSAPAVDTVHARSGDYCWGGIFNSGWFVPATRQVRVSQHRWPVSYIFTANIAEFRNNVDGLMVVVSRMTVTGLLQLQVAGVTIAIGSHPVITDAYTHIGIDLKIHPTDGWVYVYVGGYLDIAFDGNTGNQDIVKFVQRRTDLDVSYSDDWYLDDTTGELAPANVPDRSFIYKPANNNGFYSECTGQDSDSVDNYLNVDDRPHDGDTTWNEATALNQRDTYRIGAYAAPEGWEVAAVLPMAHIRKTNGGVATEVAFMVREAGTDWQGDDQGVDETYTLRLDRLELRPVGMPWGTGWGEGEVEVGFRGRGDM